MPSTRFIVSACLLMGTLPAYAEDPADVARRISGLEQQVESLRAEVGMFRLMHQTRDGVERVVQHNGKPRLRLVFAREGWGDCSAEDLAAVCVSCAETLLAGINPPGVLQEVHVVHSGQGPMVLTQRGPRGEYVMLLDSGDRLWSQVAYQFSHELGHVLCGDPTLRKPQHWFEEAFCESLSLWTLDALAKRWQTDPPYPNWAPYAPNLARYAADVRNRVEQPADLPRWWEAQRERLRRNAYDRDQNLILAVRIDAAAKADTKFLEAFAYLRRPSQNDAPNRLTWLLADWRAACPEKLRPAPEQVGQWLGVRLEK